jgi:hypothetical protein
MKSLVAKSCLVALVLLSLCGVAVADNCNAVQQVVVQRQVYPQSRVIVKEVREVPDVQFVVVNDRYSNRQDIIIQNQKQHYNQNVQRVIVQNQKQHHNNDVQQIVVKNRGNQRQNIKVEVNNGRQGVLQRIRR